MELRTTLSLISLIFFTGLEVTSVEAYHLLVEPDTLILKTEKLKGYGLFEKSSLNLHLKEISSDDTLLNFIPSNISNPKIVREFIDMKVLAYNNVKKNNPEGMDKFIKEVYHGNIDTASIISEKDNTLQIIFGEHGLDSIYIIDENNNKDFRDDPVRFFNNTNNDASEPEPIKFHYWIHNGEEKTRDSSWIIVEKKLNNKYYITVAHHLRATFSINNHEYEVQCINGLPVLRFCFDSPRISITAKNGVRKDSLLYREKLEIGDYLKFDEIYYKFESIKNNGSEITLIKEEDVSGKTGNQVGFMAPNFNCVTTDGDSISLTDYSNDYLLLVNISACWSEPMSYEIYKELSEKYHNRLAILVIDESPDVLKANIDQLGLVGKFVISTNNYSIKRNFREDFCSRDCYLIDPKGNIIDFFKIFDWEEALAKHFE